MTFPRHFFYCCAVLLPLYFFGDLSPQNDCSIEDASQISPKKEETCSKKTWYFEVNPGYLYFTDSYLRQFFGSGDFSIRGELGYKFWGPLTVWFDGGYYWDEGTALGGTERVKLRLATMTLGLKALFDVHELVSFYFGVGPRVFILLMNNECNFVRTVDNGVGIGGGFDAGMKVYPFPRNRNLYFNFMVDYSLKKLQLEDDPACSFNYDVDLSSITASLGVGIRF